MDHSWAEGAGAADHREPGPARDRRGREIERVVAARTSSWSGGGDRRPAARVDVEHELGAAAVRAAARAVNDGLRASGCPAPDRAQPAGPAG